jgi:serine kinase of HPr protein (carbohydrate metabolism regulator)
MEVKQDSFKSKHQIQILKKKDCKFDAIIDLKQNPIQSIILPSKRRKKKSFERCKLNQKKVNLYKYNTNS